MAMENTQMGDVAPGRHDTQPGGLLGLRGRISFIDLMQSVGLLAVILPTAAFAMPVSVLVLVGTLRDVSEDLYEAMALDGASPLRMLFQLTIPLAKGGISTVVIFSALQAWNGFLFPLIFTQSDGPSVVLSGIPIFAVYLVARRALVGGLMGVGGK